MSFNLKVVTGYGGAGSTTINPTTAGVDVPGNSLPLNDVVPGTLSAYVDAVAKTNTMTLSAKWQVSADGSTWQDVIPAGGTSVVAAVLTTGTGSAVEKKARIPLTDYGARYARIVLTPLVANAADAADAWAYNYNFQRRDFV